VARRPRQEAIAQVEAAVQRRRGDLLDLKQFSNLSLNLLVELDGAAVTGLVDELTALGWPAEVEPGRQTLAGRAGDRLEGTVQATFPEADGELVIPLPRVPG
jgi:hypothetical protein